MNPLVADVGSFHLEIGQTKSVPGGNIAGSDLGTKLYYAAQAAQEDVDDE